VRIVHNGRTVQELPARLTVKSQRLAWLFLLLAVVLPPVMIHYIHDEPLRGQVVGRRRLTEPPKQDAKPAAPGVPPGIPQAPTKPAADVVWREPGADTELYLRQGTPGEVLRDRVGYRLRANVPDILYRDSVIDKIAVGLGSTYEKLRYIDSDLHPPFWLGVLLLVLAFCSWVLHRPTRVRREGVVALAGMPAVTQHTDQTAETLPLAPPD
jgi:hypothetical protein